MLDYESFKKKILENFTKYLPEQYKAWEIKVSKVPKINGYLEAINLKPEKEKITAVPNLYIAELHNYYRSCGSMDQTLQKAAELFLEGMSYIKQVTSKVNLENPQENLILLLVNTEENKELLAHVPHRSFMDLSIIYRLMVELPDYSFNSAIVTDDLAKSFDLSEDQLYEIARENTPKMLPGIWEDISDDFYFLTNSFRTFGAAAMLYDGLLAKLAEILDSDLYILPSSIHEVLVLPDHIKSARELRAIVAEANTAVVKKNEVLSDKVYLYERTSGQISLA